MFTSSKNNLHKFKTVSVVLVIFSKVLNTMAGRSAQHFSVLVTKCGKLTMIFCFAYEDAMVTLNLVNN